MYWLVDRMLPSLVAGIPIFAAGLWYQAKRLRAHVDQVTADQTTHLATNLDRKLATQTAQLKDRG